MGKLPKQYRRKDGETSPEKVDVDDELERQFSRSNRERSAEKDRERLHEKKEERRIGTLYRLFTVYTDKTFF
jgi:hypothetical protein